MNSLDKQYKGLLIDILDNGVKKETRNGVTYSVFGRQIRHDMREGFPLLTTKKMWWKGIVGELLWFLSGSSDIRDLWKRKITIWDGDWYKNYKERVSSPYTLEEIKEKLITGNHSFPEDMFDLGPIYGKQWRRWQPYSKAYGGMRSIGYYENDEPIDQIKELTKSLSENPDSRRMLVSAWNVGELDDMVLPPCHYSFQVWTRELTIDERFELYDKKMEGKIDTTEVKTEESLNERRIPKRGISLLWNQRSVDTPLGLPFNIASYGLLLHMIADEAMMVPLELIGNLGDTHIYENQVDGVMEQIDRKIHPLPTLWVRDGIYSHEDNIHLENYTSEDTINFPLSN